MPEGSQPHRNLASGRYEVKAKHKAYDRLGGAKLQILNPVDFADTFEYEGRGRAIEAHLANYGHFQLGTSITASVYYPLIDTKACGNMAEEAELANENNLKYTGIVIVDAGECSYEKKSRNIEQMGAQAAIIIEDEPLSDFEDTTDKLMKRMIYDGTGSSVHVPTILIS